MKSKLTASFVQQFGKLDSETQKRTRRAYREWRANEQARRFKSSGRNVSVRIDSSYRAVGYIEGDTVFWFWIGRHDEYDRKF